MDNSVVMAVLTKKLSPGRLEPGNYEVDGVATVRIRATVKKGLPTTYRPTVSLPLKAVLAIALRKAGVMREHIGDLIAEAACEALNGGGSVESELKATEEALQRVEALLDKLPPQSREGATKIEGMAELIGFSSSDHDVIKVA